MIKKFTEQDMQNYADYVAKAVLSNITPNLDRWYAEWHKPTKKVIDLSVLIESGIDCEFDDRGNTSAIAKLETITTSRVDEASLYISAKGVYWDRCRPRMNHKHAWLGGECPLPEGFMVMPHYRKPLKLRVPVMATDLLWGNWGGDLDIIAFEVLGVADGYVMPWEHDND